jgi:hypothetical protein
MNKENMVGPGVVVLAFNPSYLRGGARRIMVQI